MDGQTSAVRWSSDLQNACFFLFFFWGGGGSVASFWIIMWLGPAKRATYTKTCPRPPGEMGKLCIRIRCSNFAWLPAETKHPLWCLWDLNKQANPAWFQKTTANLPKNIQRFCEFCDLVFLSCLPTTKGSTTNLLKALAEHSAQLLTNLFQWKPTSTLGF